MLRVLLWLVSDMKKLLAISAMAALPLLAEILAALRDEERCRQGMPPA